VVFEKSACLGAERRIDAGSAESQCREADRSVIVPRGIVLQRQGADGGVPDATRVELQCGKAIARVIAAGGADDVAFAGVGAGIGVIGLRAGDMDGRQGQKNGSDAGRDGLHAAIGLNNWFHGKWYLKAAAQNSAKAQFNLGMLAHKRSTSDAVMWWQKAAAQNDPRAQFNMGLAYSQGVGVIRNPAKAASYWSIAAANKLEQAKQKLAELEPTMTPAQKTESNQLASEMMEKMKRK